MMTNDSHGDRAADDERLMALVGCTRGIVLELDGDARYLNAWADDPGLLARPAAELIGMTIDEVLGEAGPPFTAMVRRVFATGTIEHLEYPIDLETGRRWFFADVKRVGHPARGMSVVFFARDITDRRAIEEALASSEERYRLAAQATNDILWDWTFGCDIVTWNAGVTTVLGYDHAGSSVEWWKSHVHPDDRARVIAGLEAVLASDASAWSDRYRFARADGSYADFMDRGFIVRDAARAPVRMIGSMTDVTAINRLQTQLVQSDRLVALGTLAAGVGHEINNPLSYVVGNLESLLEMAAGSDPEQRPLVTEALDGARRIAEIVRSLRLFSRPDTSEIGPTDLHAVADAAMKMAENEIRFRARLTRELQPVPAVTANAGQLAQVCLNLLINAAQAIEPGRPDAHEITVSTGVDAHGSVVLAVKDTGTGIAPDVVERIFDPFFTTKPLGVGSGLGLAICHGIVHKLGGSIWVETTPGVGSTFFVKLQAAEPVAPKRYRVLLIDDEAQMGRVVTRIFGKRADVVHLPRAREALTRLASPEAFDLVLCDLMMPEMSGIELYGELQRVAPEVLPNLHFISGGAFGAKADEFLASHASRCLEKPLDRARLLSLLPAA